MQSSEMITKSSKEVKCKKAKKNEKIMKALQDDEKLEV